MNVVALIGALAVGGGAAAVASLVVPPTRRLAGRVRPYTLMSRAALGHPPDVAIARAVPTTWFSRTFGAPLRLATPVVDRAGDRGDDRLARLLRQAAIDDMTPEEFRTRQIAEGAVFGAAAGVAVGLLTHAPLVALFSAAAGYIAGSTRPRKRLERAITERAARIRTELYTVNHLLAMHVRTGSGPIQAAQRVVDRGRGALVEELTALLGAIRHGVSEADAFRRAADETPEPSAARTYQLLAASAERGSDLGAALLALSEDVRDARREQLHKDAVRRRAAMLVPTIAILAPIMLLFIAAPLPSIVLGSR
jgi:Flp pilus assembly protein TadB